MSTEDAGMERLQRAAVVLSLVEKLQAKGSWCGETHIQKATYFLEELLDVPLGYEFVLYKHGPYSFQLSDAITEMQVDGLLRVEPKPYPYGPSLMPGSQSDQLKRRYPKTINRYDTMASFIAEKLGQMNVAELERYATALYVLRERGTSDDCTLRAQRLHDLKPHIPIDAARAAIEEVSAFMNESRSLLATA